MHAKTEELNFGPTQLTQLHLMATHPTLLYECPLTIWGGLQTGNIILLTILLENLYC